MVLEINIHLSYEWISGQGRWLSGHKSKATNMILCNDTHLKVITI